MKKLNFSHFLKSSKNIVTSLAVSLILAAGVTFAWNAVWHGTDWIKSGAVINAQKVAENFEFLYNRLPDPNDGSCQDGDILRFNGNLKKFECFRCNEGETLQRKDNVWSCSTKPTKRMCRLWYRIGGDPYGWSNWASTPWASFDSQWYSGVGTQSPGSWVNPGRVQLKLECQQAPAPMSVEYAINQDQWDGDTLADINQSYHASVPQVQDGVKEGSIAQGRKLSRPNNAVFGAKIQGNGEVCSVAYRIAGDGNHWSNWQQDGTLAFTGRARGKTYLSTLNNMVLQMQLCCGSSCSTIGVGAQNNNNNIDYFIGPGDCGGGGC